jgi:exopolysaccharide production protein ExoQ
MATETYSLIGRRRFKNLLLGRLLGRSIWGLGDQALISASNFLTTVVLARRLNPTDFGAFTLLYAAVFFMVSLQTTLVSRPHNVLGATRQGEEYRRYTTVTAVSQVCFTAMFALVALTAALVAQHAAWGVAPLLFPLALVIVAWQLQEFTRRVLYTEGRLRDAFANDLISYGGQATGIVALGYVGQLSGARAFSIIALTSAVAAAYGFWQIRGSLICRGVWDAVRADGFAENWRFGKWLFGAALAAWVAGQLYPILIGGFISIAEAGAFSAVFTLMGPARILLIAMDTALVPAGARAFAERGQAGLQSFVGRIFLLTAPIIAVYCIGVSLLASRILGAAYGDHYRPYGWLLALFALSYALDYLRHPISIALEARRASAPIFRAYLLSSIVVLTAGIAAVRFLGLLGAALGTIANSLILGVLLWRYYGRAAMTNVSATSAATTPTANPYFVSRPVAQRPARPMLAARPRPMAAHLQPRASRVRAAAQSAAVPLWEKGFAVLGIFLCLDAGVRTLRILSGTEGPIRGITSAEVDYSQGSTLTQILLFAVYLISLMLLVIGPTRQLRYAFKAKLFWLLPVLALVSVTWSGAPSISFRRAVALLGSSIFGFYLGVRFSRADLLRLLLAVSVIATILTLLTVVALPAYAIDDSGAWQGVFGQKNHLGRFMALSAVLWLLYAASFRRHRFLAGLSVVSVILVLLSHSATSVALLFILIAVLLLIRLVRVRSKAVVPILALVVVVSGYLAAIVAKNPGRATALLGRDSSLTGRTQLWSLVLQMIHTHLWRGYGYGGFWLGFDGPSAAIWSVVNWNPPSAHDGFLDLMLDLGIAGAIVFVPAMLIAIRYAIALARRGGTLDAAFPLIFLVFYLLSNLTESYLVAYNTESWVLFVAITIQLHKWWYGEGRVRPRAAARAADIPLSGSRGLSRLPPFDVHGEPRNSAPVSKERIAFQEGTLMSARVTVSAIMPTYNAMPYLEDAIESVLAQTFTDWELIIVDDGSTDETHALLARYKDPRIRVFELGEHGGIAKARAIALGFACGTYIAITESDSRSLPERFAREVAYLERHAEVHVVASQVGAFSARGVSRPHVLYPEEPEEIQRGFARGRMAVPFSAAMIRSWCFDRFGPFRDDMPHAAGLEWFLRIRRSCNFRVLPEVLCLNRHRMGGITFSQWIGEREYERYAVYRAGMFGSSADRRAQSFDQFTRRWGTRLGLYTGDVLRFVFRRRSNAAGRNVN